MLDTETQLLKLEAMHQNLQEGGIGAPADPPVSQQRGDRPAFAVAHVLTNDSKDLVLLKGSLCFEQSYFPEREIL